MSKTYFLFLLIICIGSHSFASNRLACDVPDYLKAKRFATGWYLSRPKPILANFSSIVLKSRMSQVDVEEYCSEPIEIIRTYSSISEERIKDYLGDVCYMKVDKAQQYCDSLNSHIPTVVDFLNLTQSRGASGLISKEDHYDETDNLPWFMEGCRFRTSSLFVKGSFPTSLPINKIYYYATGLGTYREIFYSSAGYLVPTNPYDQQKFWTTADFGKATLNLEYLNIYDGHEGGFLSNYNKRNLSAVAVKCVPGRVAPAPIENETEKKYGW